MASHPRFNLFTGKGDKFYFNLTASNGQVILSSQGYANKSGAKNGIASVKKNSGDDSKFDRKQSKDAKHFFNLLAGNKQIIGSSQRYASKASMENGIASVRTNAPKADIQED
ncbi:MAG: YegP family protein [Thermoanaerobaculia bacterium]|nr:YegP family protein [Thermoanaerobaculia bacterium]